MRIAVSSSFGCTEVSCVMSIFGPMKNSSAPTTRSPFVLRMTNLASSATSAGAVSDGLTATQRSAVEQRVLAVHALRRVGEAGVAAGAVAGQAVAVVQAARVLRDVAADRAGVADLRAGHAARRIGQHAVVRADRSDCARSRSAWSARRSRCRPAFRECPCSSAMPVRSITALGRLMRSLNQLRLSLPPASFQPSAR